MLACYELWSGQTKIKLESACYFHPARNSISSAEAVERGERLQKDQGYQENKQIFQ